MTIEWSSVWPTEPGNYWFYGHRFRSEIGDNLPKEMFLVKAVKTGNNKPAFIADGNFMFRDDGAQGLWAKAVLPDAPK
jgi:hypothetical protein